MQKYIVRELEKEVTLKDYLRKFSGVSATLWKKIKAYNKVWINGVQVRPTWALVRSGDIITLDLPVHSEVVPQEYPVEILWEDDYLILINKPAGVLTHPLKDHPDISIANGLAYYFQKTKQEYGIHPIYRLDRNTSGILCFAKWPQIQQLWGGNHQLLRRRYWALVSGRFEEPEGMITNPIGRQDGSIIKREVRADGQVSITHYRVVEEFMDYSLVELELATGRTHQIRVHLSSIGHPLLGDDLYGGTRELISRQALHALSVEFTHPYTQEEYKFNSPLPSDMAELLPNYHENN